MKEFKYLQKAELAVAHEFVPEAENRHFALLLWGGWWVQRTGRFNNSNFCGDVDNNITPRRGIKLCSPACQVELLITTLTSFF